MIKKFKTLREKYKFSNEQLLAVEDMFCMDRYDKRILSTSIILKTAGDVVKELGPDSMSNIVNEIAYRLNKNTTSISVTLNSHNYYKKNISEVIKYSNLW